VSSGLISPGMTRPFYAVIDLLRPQNHNKTPIRYCLTLFDCRRLFQSTKPSAATSSHHSVDHLITHRNVDPDWSEFIKIPAPLQLIQGAE